MKFCHTSLENTPKESGNKGPTNSCNSEEISMIKIYPELCLYGSFGLKAFFIEYAQCLKFMITSKKNDLSFFLSKYPNKLEGQEISSQTWKDITVVFNRVVIFNRVVFLNFTHWQEMKQKISEKFPNNNVMEVKLNISYETAKQKWGH